MGAIDDIKDIVRGAIASLGGFGGRMLARLVLMIAAGHLYGAESLGVLGQVAAITEILAAVAILGLRRGLLDMMSEDEEAGRNPASSLIAALLVSVGAGILMSALLWLAWPWLFPTLTMPPVLLAAIPCIVFADVAGTAIRFKRIIRWEVIARCVMEPWAYLAATLLLYWLGFTETGLVTAYAASAIAAAVGILFGLQHAFGLRSLLSAGTGMKQMLAVPRRSIAAGITDIGTMMFRRLDILLLSLVAGHSATGLYYMAQQIVTVPHKIHQLFEPMLSPVMAKLHHQVRRDLIGAKLAGICRWVFTLQLAVTVPFMVFAGDLLSLFGAEFAAAALVLCLLLVAELFDGSFALTETPLLFAVPGVPPRLILATLALEALAVTGFAALWGAPGAALGFAVAMAALNLARLISLRRRLSINVITPAYGRPLLFAGLIGTALLLLQPLAGPDAPLTVGLLIAVAVALFLLLVRLLAVTPADREIVRQLRSS